MSAVLEMTQEELEQYVMPRPARGQQVLWYPDADRTKEPEIAFVKGVSKRSLVLQVNGVAIDTVRHVNDPKMKVNEFQRVNGGWDYPETELRLQELLKRIESLEKAVAERMWDKPEETEKKVHWKTLEKLKKEEAAKDDVPL